MAASAVNTFKPAGRRRVDLDVRPARAGGGVRYSSRGRLLVIGGAQHYEYISASLPGTLSRVFLLDTSTEDSLEAGDSEIVHGRVEDLDGYLGAFRVTASIDGRNVDLGRACHPREGIFDLILDLSTTPCLDRPVPPPGYFRPGPDGLQDVLADLPEHVGEFEKPRYFDYRSDICAHGGSEAQGCDRCLEVCGAKAIRPMDHAIEVDPHLCQGCGVCATVCPTGAIRYDYPDAADLAAQLRRTLRETEPADPVTVILYDSDTIAARPGGAGTEVWLRVEEAGSVGGDIWLAALCYGADRLVMVLTGATPALSRDAVREQIDVYNRVLAGLGHGGDRLATVDADKLDDALAPEPEPMDRQPAGFAGFNEKRTLIELALGHLYEQSSAAERYRSLPEAAPFGNVRVDADGCTLCMACAGICPAGALQDGGGEPLLKFIEANCIQCGACRDACPENVIELEPRMDYDRDAAKTPRLVKEDEAVHCEDCGKPFGTRSMIRAIAAKLEDHWMYQTNVDRNLFRLCGDCRAKRMFSAGTAGGSRIKASMAGKGGDS